jgi:hypothetical protein
MSCYDYDRNKTASISRPYPDPNPGYVTVWVELESYGRVHHVTGDLVKAQNILDASRQSVIAAQSEFLKLNLPINIEEIVVDGSKNKGRNKMVVYFTVTPVGGKKFSDIEQGMIMSKLKGVHSSEKKAPIV